MGSIEISPKELYNELNVMRERERTRLINESLQGRKLTNVQRRQLEMELEGSTRFMDGELTAVNEEGDILRDPHGWPVSVQQHIRQTAKTLLGVEPQAQPQDKAPADGQELFNRMKAAQSDEERVKLYAAYKGGWILFAE